MEKALKTKNGGADKSAHEPNSHELLERLLMRQYPMAQDQNSEEQKASENKYSWYLDINALIEKYSNEL